MTALSADDGRLIVRRAVEGDIPAIEALVDLNVRGHPAERHVRSREALHRAYFSDRPVASLLLASRRGQIVGMAEWSLIYDMFWSKFGGHGEWLFVRPEARGSGIVAAIVAQMCADIARAGGEFLRGSPDDAVVARLYGRLAIGGAGQPYYLSASAFRSFGALAGLPPRDIVRRLPDPSLNHVE